MRGAKEIIKKELSRVFNDKKLIVSLFIMPGILIIGMYYFIGQMQSAMVNDLEEHIPTVYIQNEPEGFKSVLTASDYQADIKYLEEGEDLAGVKEGILNGDIDLLVVFEKGFLENISNYQTAGVIPEVKTYYNTSEDYSANARSIFVSQVLDIYQQQLLTERFGDLSQLSVFQIDKDPESSIIVNNEKASGKAFGMLLPYLITFMLFQGAMALGVDAITGEKERGTMASMLLTPLKRSEIVVGKIISISILSSLSAIIYAVAMIFAMPLLMGGSSANTGEMALNFTIGQGVQLLAILLALVYLYVAIIALASVLARTVKEASSYVTPMMIVVIAAGLVTMFTGNSDKQLAMFAIPVYGSAISIQNILVGELTLEQFGMTVGGTVVLAIITTYLITKAFNSEKVMFNA
jgi:sodium transport system permease protein